VDLALELELEMELEMELEEELEEEFEEELEMELEEEFDEELEMEPGMDVRKELETEVEMDDEIELEMMTLAANRRLGYGHSYVVLADLGSYLGRKILIDARVLRMQSFLEGIFEWLTLLLPCILCNSS
jgi:hypothetical protein